MTVKIVTDSVSDLSPEIAGELGITVVPLYVHFGTEAYHDGIDLTTDEFYHKLMHAKTLPTTAAPSAGSFAEIYDRLSEETDEIVAIVASNKLSATYGAAVQGREMRKSKCRLEIVDSQWGLMAEGLVVIAAAKAAKTGASLDEMLAVTHRNIHRVDLRVAFDTLEYLRRGGRIGAAQAFLGSVLKINPILTMRDGVIHPVARKHSRAKAIDYLHDFAMSFSHIEEIAIEDATTPDEAEMLGERLSSKFPKERIYQTKLGPAVGTHLGPCALNIAVLGDRA